MALFRRLTMLAGAAEAARRYARKNPDKAGKYLDQAAAFVDKQTKGKYSNQIKDVAAKAKGAAGVPNGPGHAYGQPMMNGQEPTHGGPPNPDQPVQEHPPNPQQPTQGFPPNPQ